MGSRGRLFYNFFDMMSFIYLFIHPIQPIFIIFMFFINYLNRLANPNPGFFCHANQE